MFKVKNTTLTPQLQKFSKVFYFPRENFKIQSEEELMKHILKSALVMRLRECNEKIADFEGRYAKNFNQFMQDWKQSRIPNKYSEQTEGDFMDWEALEMLKLDILELLVDL